jgi:hypothetical protein
MAQPTQLSDSEKIDYLNKRLKRMEYSQHIQTAIAVIVFLGIVNFGVLLTKVKKEF